MMSSIPSPVEKEVRSFHDLIVWQKAMELTEKVYQRTNLFPKEEMYGLQSQTRRAAVSVPSNIAEGQSRNGRREFIQFLGIAKGSLAELQTQLILSARLNFLTKRESEELQSDCNEVSKLLTGLLKSLAARPSPLTTNH